MAQNDICEKCGGKTDYVGKPLCLKCWKEGLLETSSNKGSQPERLVKSASIQIGIDFGTTNSIIVAYDKSRNRFTYFNFDQSDMTKPVPTSSTVWYYDDKIVVGAEARESIYRYANIEGHHFEKSIKLKLGQEHGLNIFGRTVPPYEIAGVILKSIKRIAIDEWKADKSGVDLNRAILTVPIDFSGVQRRALRKAAREAGIEVTTFIHEPFAAIVGYYFTNEEYHGLSDILEHLKALEGKFILTFDWGGGTLDITVIKVENGKMIELGTAEMTERAGDKFDEDIANLAWDKFTRKLGDKYSKAFLEQKKKDNWDRILTRAERCKIALSDYESHNFLVDNIVDELDISETITRKDFEKLIENTIVDSCNEIDKAIKIARIGDINIHHVLLTGGTCYIPAIQERLKEKFGHRVETVNNAELLIAQGAAVIAEMGWLPFLTKDISVELSDESLYPIFSKDTPLAADSDAKKSEDFICVDPRGGDAKMIIVEGDGQRKDKNLAVLKVPVLNDTRFMDDIKLDAILDRDIVLTVKARSQMCHGYGQAKYGQKDENYTIQKSTEVHQLCFGLDFMGGDENAR